MILRRLVVALVLSAWALPALAQEGVGISNTSAGPKLKVDIYTTVATHKWKKEPWAREVCALVYGPGGAGGGGAFGTSDSGGGGGGSGAIGWGCWAAASILVEEDAIIPAAAAGGAGRNTNGSGSQGADPGEVSFGAAARNLIRINPTQAISGGGGDTGAGAAGTLALGSYTTVIAPFLIVGSAGGVGDDAAPGIAATSVATAAGLIWPFGMIVPPSPGGGGGGHNGGANHTTGGAGGAQTQNISVNLRAGVAGGATNGAAGAPGTTGGYNVSSLLFPLEFAGGLGGAGGAGGEGGTQDGGAAGIGGPCGGGGAGGGSSESGTAGSAAGGNGGVGCIIVVQR